MAQAKHRRNASGHNSNTAILHNCPHHIEHRHAKLNP